MIESLPTDYDIFFLDDRWKANENYINDDKSIIKLRAQDYFHGMHAYIISNETINKLMKTYIFNSAIDVFILNMNRDQDDFNIYLHIENDVYLGEIPSEIHAMGRAH